MIPAVAQTLAETLAGEISPIAKEHIDFDRPSVKVQHGPKLTLYCYDVRKTPSWKHGNPHDKERPDSSIWFDVSFLVTVWDRTTLGEQYLLSEILKLLLRYPCLPEKFLAPTLRGYRNLPLQVASDPIDKVALWQGLGVPLRPALYITVTIPFDRPNSPSVPECISCQSTP